MGIHPEQVVTLTAVELECSASPTTRGRPNCHDPGLDNCGGGDDGLFSPQFCGPSWLWPVHHRFRSHSVWPNM